MSMRINFKSIKLPWTRMLAMRYHTVMKKSTSRLPQHIFLTVNSRSRAPCVTFTPSLFRSVKSDASKGKKKKVTQSDAKIASLQNVDLPNGWIKKFLALGSTDLANVLALLANEGKVSFSQLKRAGIGLPSFSSARWSELASSFNLPVDLSMSDLKAEFDHFSISPVLLPPSFHEAIAKAAWHFQDVYQEPLFHEREETHVRFLDAVCSIFIELLCCIFTCSCYASIISQSLDYSKAGL